MAPKKVSNNSDEASEVEKVPKIEKEPKSEKESKIDKEMKTEKEPKSEKEPKTEKELKTEKEKIEKVADLKEPKSSPQKPENSKTHNSGKGKKDEKSIGWHSEATQKFVYSDKFIQELILNEKNEVFRPPKMKAKLHVVLPDDIKELAAKRDLERQQARKKIAESKKK